jgi:hypothetical protein
MKERLLLVGCFAALTLLSFLQFPGHTILQSDTQIYLPILAHLENPAVLARDLVAVKPHLAYTIYDETTQALHRLTGLTFERVLMGEQLLYRMLGILGLFLIAGALGFSWRLSIILTAIVSLGATVAGPAVLTVEYEPVPRAFALPFLLLSLGCLLHDRWKIAAVASGVAFLFHPPTALAYCGLLGIAAIWRKRIDVVLILLATGAIMLAFVYMQQGITEQQHFFSRIPAWLEKLQRMRASYNWVSMWIGRWGWHYLFLWIFSLIALLRMRHLIPVLLWVFALGLPAIGMLSLPLSYLLLERMKWTLMPQFQPGRYLLFVTLFAMLLGSAAGISAARSRRFLEAFFFFGIAVMPALDPNVLAAPLLHFAIAAAIASLATVAAACDGRMWALPVWAAAAFAPFFMIPMLGHVRNYPSVHTPELNDLAAWAHASTAEDAIFQFADAGQNLQPGIFRVRSRRALYADWKSGGQVNFLPSFALLWWDRWQQVEKPQKLARYQELGINYVVYQQRNRPPGEHAVFENSQYVVFKTRAGEPPETRPPLSARELRPALPTGLLKSRQPHLQSAEHPQFPILH